MTINDDYYNQLHKTRSLTYRKVNEAHARYLDLVSGLFNIRFTQIRSCPVCSSKNYKTIFQKSGGLYAKCEDCGMIYTNPGFTQDALEEYYTNLDVGHAENLEREAEFYREIYSGGISHFSPYTTGKNLLDLGCSSGFFLDIAREHGYKTHGLELNSSDFKIAITKGHNVYNTTLEKLDTNKTYDIITMWDVLEHISTPKEYLRIVFSHLKSAGILFLQIPNSGSLAASILQQKCNMFDGLEHVCLFDSSTIAKLINECGYAIKSMSSVIPEVYAVKNFLSYEDPYFPGDKIAQSPVFERLSDDFVLAKLLGYKLQVVISR